MHYFNILLKSILRKRRIYLRKHTHLPYGTDLSVDLERLFKDITVRTIFDVGANIGQSAEAFRRFFPESTVYCFEPVSATYQILVDNLGGNKHVKSFHCALGEETRTQTMYFQEDPQWNSLASSVNKPRAESERGETVQVITLDGFLSDHGINTIDLLKIDTEGYELAVLKGAKRSFKVGRVALVLAEVTFDNNDSRHTAFGSLQYFLLSYGFSLVAIYDQCVNRGTQCLSYCNALFRA